MADNTNKDAQGAQDTAHTQVNGLPEKKSDQKTTEQIVAETILQTSTTGSKIDIDGMEYTITDPTPATLMMVSAEVSCMPHVNQQADNILFEVLRMAKDAQPIGRIAAILILGAKRVRENYEISWRKKVRKWSWRKFRHITEWKVMKTQNELDWLAEQLIDTLTTATLSNLIMKRLGEMQIGDFFGLTTSLSAINILKPTKEVETARGE